MGSFQNGLKCTEKSDDTTNNHGFYEKEKTDSKKALKTPAVTNLESSLVTNVQSPKAMNMESSIVTNVESTVRKVESPKSNGYK